MNTLLNLYREEINSKKVINSINKIIREKKE